MRLPVERNSPQLQCSKIALLGVVATVCLMSQTSAATNILFIYLDDFGWRDAGFLGSDFYETPHLDRLASQGMVFTDAYSCAANCAPARACLLSGQYAPRHEVYNVGTHARGDERFRRLLHVAGREILDPDIRTWALQLQDAGYATALIGKWHLSEDPIPYGFDKNIGGTLSGSPPKGYYPPFGNAPGLQSAPEGQYLTDLLNQEAIQFIRRHRNEPWALYLTHFAVHTPLEPKRELVAKYLRKRPGKLHHHVAMATMIQAVDDGVGRIVSALDELGLTEKTAVIFYSDNGGYGTATDMHPLKGYKGTFYEGGIRVPFFVTWPGVVPAGTTCRVPIIGVDLFPTLCQIAGADLPDAQPLDGQSILPLLTGERTSLGERPLFWHFPAYLESFNPGDEQRDPLFRTRPCSVVRLGDWKLHEYFEDGGLELYHLAEDIGEENNVAAKYPQQTRALHDRLVKWRMELGAAVPSEPNPAYDAAAESQAMAALGPDPP